MAKMDDGNEDEDINIIRAEIIELFHASAMLISNSGGMRLNVFIRKCSNYFHLNSQRKKVLDELKKMEKDELLIISDFFIKFTESGIKEIFG